MHTCEPHYQHAITRLQRVQVHKAQLRTLKNMHKTRWAVCDFMQHPHAIFFLNYGKRGQNRAVVAQLKPCKRKRDKEQIVADSSYVTEASIIHRCAVKQRLQSVQKTRISWLHSSLLLFPASHSFIQIHSSSQSVQQLNAQKWSSPPPKTVRVLHWSKHANKGQYSLIGNASAR